MSAVQGVDRGSGKRRAIGLTVAVASLAAGTAMIASAASGSDGHADRSGPAERSSRGSPLETITLQPGGTAESKTSFVKGQEYTVIAKGSVSGSDGVQSYAYDSFYLHKCEPYPTLCEPYSGAVPDDYARPEAKDEDAGSFGDEFVPLSYYSSSGGWPGYEPSHEYTVNVTKASGRLTFKDNFPENGYPTEGESGRWTFEVYEDACPASDNRRQGGGGCRGKWTVDFRVGQKGQPTKGAPDGLNYSKTTGRGTLTFDKEPRERSNRADAGKGTVVHLDNVDLAGVLDVDEVLVMAVNRRRGHTYSRGDNGWLLDLNVTVTKTKQSDCDRANDFYRPAGRLLLFDYAGTARDRQARHDKMWLKIHCRNGSDRYVYKQIFEPTERNALDITIDPPVCCKP